MKSDIQGGDPMKEPLSRDPARAAWSYSESETILVPLHREPLERPVIGSWLQRAGEVIGQVWRRVRDLQNHGPTPESVFVWSQDGT